MDTKEKSAPVRRRRRPPQGTRSNTKQQPRRQTQKRKRPVQAQPKPQPQRKIRGPREDIPEAVYTMPKPLHRGKFLLRLVSVVAAVLAAMIALSIFFKVETVTVLGTHKYSPWMIMEASGIEEGDGLLTLSKARAAGKIKSALPYVDEVKIYRKLPSTVHIEVTELAVTYAVASQDTSWWLIDSDGEAVEPIDAATATGYTRLLGVTIQTPRAGQLVAAAQTAQPESTEATGETEGTESTDASEEITIPTQPQQTDAQRLDTALSILRSLEENGVIGQVSYIQVESLVDITLGYGQRFEVKLGNSDRLSYKIGYMTQAISQMAEHQTGVLDVSFEFSEQGIFTPES